MKKTKIIKKIFTHSILIMSATIAAPTTAADDIVYYNGFESMAIDQASKSDVKTAWSTRYAKGPDEGRLSVTENGYLGHGGYVLYPAGGNTTSHSGAHWETNIGAEKEDLYMSYWVKLDADFQCVKGGKLPGLAGSESFPYGENDWTARLMWREDCKLEWYLHDFGMKSAQGIEPYRVFWDDFGEHATLIPGQWHKIELRVKLNTPGKLDGKLQGWLDDVMYSDNTDTSGIRASGNHNVKINQLLFSTFFGGSSAPVAQWQPTEDVYATFDEFTVYTRRSDDDPVTVETDDDNDGVLNSADQCANTPAGSNVDENGCVQVNTLECSTVTELSFGARNEVILTGNNSCVHFNNDLAGKTLQLWDSDVNNSCHFRGTVSSVDGSGSSVIASNYISLKNFTGSTFKVSPNNNCQFIKMRAY